MSGDGHDRSGAVAHENVVGNPNRDFLAVDGIDRQSPCENAAFVFREIRTIEVAFARDSGAVFFYGLLALRCCDARNKRMLGSEDHVGRAKKGVRARGENGDRFFAALGGEPDLGTFAASDPIFLEKLDALGPIETVQSFDQAVGKGRDAEHPLAEWPPLDGKSTNFALAIHDFLVGQNSAEFRAPVDWHFGDISETDVILVVAGVCGDRFRAVRGWVEPSIVELKKNPLGPLDITWIGRADLAIPVVAEADGLELPTEIIDIAGRGDARMLAGFDGVLLCWQTECIPTHRVKHVVALHAVEAGENVRGRVAFDMADMKSVSTGIWEHVEDVVFRTRGVEAG